MAGKWRPPDGRVERRCGAWRPGGTAPSTHPWSGPTTSPPPTCRRSEPTPPVGGVRTPLRAPAGWHRPGPLVGPRTRADSRNRAGPRTRAGRRNRAGHGRPGRTPPEWASAPLSRNRRRPCPSPQSGRPAHLTAIRTPRSSSNRPCCPPQAALGRPGHRPGFRTSVSHHRALQGRPGRPPAAPTEPGRPRVAPTRPGHPPAAQTQPGRPRAAPTQPGHHPPTHRVRRRATRRGRTRADPTAVGRPADTRSARGGPPTHLRGRTDPSSPGARTSPSHRPRPRR